MWYESNKPIKSKSTYRQSINQPKGLQWKSTLDWLIYSTVGKIAPRGWFPGGSKKWPNTAGQYSNVSSFFCWVYHVKKWILDHWEGLWHVWEPGWKNSQNSQKISCVLVSFLEKGCECLVFLWGIGLFVYAILRDFFYKIRFFGLGKRRRVKKLRFLKKNFLFFQNKKLPE